METQRRHRLPTLNISLPIAFNQHISDLDVSNWVKWISQWSSGSEQKKKKFRDLPFFVSYLWPKTGVEQFELIVKIIALIFILDDESDDPEVKHRKRLNFWNTLSIAAEMLRTDDGPDTRWPRCIQGLFHCLKAVYKQLAPISREILITCWKLYADGNITEADQRLTNMIDMDLNIWKEVIFYCFSKLYGFKSLYYLKFSIASKQ